MSFSFEEKMLVLTKAGFFENLKKRIVEHVKQRLHVLQFAVFPKIIKGRCISSCKSRHINLDDNINDDIWISSIARLLVHMALNL